MNRLNKYILTILTIIGVISCKKGSLNAPEASFMIANPSVTITNSSIQGSNSHKITDMWLYVNDQFQGCYSVGKPMPIVASGSATIKLFAGIKNNGIADTRQPYFFYKPVAFTQNVEAGKTYTIAPSFEYLSSTNFLFADNFDAGASHFQPLGDSLFVINSNDAYGGTGKSVFMSMSDAKPTAEMITSSYFYVPLSSAAVYLEMNYKCNQEINIGIISNNENRRALTLNPSSDWNKIYVDLRTVINTLPASPACKFYISATKNTAYPLIYIDNVKVITE